MYKGRGDFMKSKRNGEIDLLRFVFAMAILVFHFNDLFTYGVFCNGNICVEFFFIVSGYLMAKQTEKYKFVSLSKNDVANTVWTLTLKKIFPIYTYYFSAVVLQIIIRYLIIQKMGLLELISGLLKSIPTFTLSFMGLLHDYDVSFYVGNTWYLSALLIASLLLYPFLIKFHDFTVKIICPLAALFLIGFIFVNYEKMTVWKDWTGFCFQGVIRAFGEMSLGAFLVPLSESFCKKLSWLTDSKKVPVKLFLTAVKVFVFAVVIIYALGFEFGGNFSLHALLFIAFGIMLSFANVGYCIKDSKFTRYMGKISLPIFIFHGFIRWTFGDVYHESEVTLKIFILMIVGTTLTCIILMYLVDFMKIGGKKLLLKIKSHC